MQRNVRSALWNSTTVTTSALGHYLDVRVHCAPDKVYSPHVEFNRYVGYVEIPSASGYLQLTCPASPGPAQRCVARQAPRPFTAIELELTMAGRTPASPLTYSRISTDDDAGEIVAYLGEGKLTDDELATFGTRAVAQIPDLDRLMRFICTNGFEHHVVMNPSHTAPVLQEAFTTYLGWSTYVHGSVA